MGGFVESVLIGAVVGAGTAAATGGDPKKGATRGAAGGAIGGVVGPAAQVSGVRTGSMIGGGIGGATAKKTALGKFPTSMGRDPAAKTVLAGEHAESMAEKLKKRKRYKTALTGDYGDLTLGSPGLLGM